MSVFETHHYWVSSLLARAEEVGELDIGAVTVPGIKGTSAQKGNITYYYYRLLPDDLTVPVPG